MSGAGKSFDKWGYKMLVLTNSGSMIGYYNAALLKELGCDVPKTIEEYKVAAEKLKENIRINMQGYLQEKTRG